MKIGYIWQREKTDLDLARGPVLHVRAVIDGLRRRGHAVRLVTYKDARPAWTDDLVGWHELSPRGTNAPGFRLLERTVRGVQSRLRLPFARLFDSARFADAALPALRDRELIYERHDVLASGGVMAGRRLGLPVVLELNGDFIEEYHEQGISLTRGQWAVIRQVTRRTFDMAAHIITVSDSLRLKTIDRWQVDPAMVSTVANGVDINTFMNPIPVESLNNQWRPNGRPLIIHVGSFQPWHSLDLLIEAFAQISSGTNANLVLVGDGQLRSDIEAQVENKRLCDRVKFTGRLPHSQVGFLVNQADVAVLAHRPTVAASSGTPLKLLEYMAAGKAIVAPDLENITAILEDGRTALLFEAGSAPSMGNTLLRLLRDVTLRQTIGRNAQEVAIENYSWDKTVGQLDDIFRSLLSVDG